MSVIENAVFAQKQMKNCSDTFQKMTRKIINEIHDQLSDINFDGTISLRVWRTTLHNDIPYIVKKLSNVSKVEVITTVLPISKKLQELYISDVSKVLVSMYDGPEQIKKFNEMTKKANVPEDLIILRDRWYDQYNDFGVKLTNRAGTINTGDQEEIGKFSNCLSTYQFNDWNGNVFMSSRLAEESFNGQYNARDNL